MSRTDKDRPWQIRANDLTGRYNGAYYWHDHWHHERRGGCSDDCGWTLPHCQLSRPPAWYRRHVWHAPERVRERNQLGGYAREYNAGFRPYDGVGEDPQYDLDFANYQHRHMAHWTWC